MMSRILLIPILITMCLLGSGCSQLTDLVSEITNKEESSQVSKMGIEGSVVSRLGLPVYNQTVHLVRNDTRVRYTAITDTEGRFAFGSFPEDDVMASYNIYTMIPETEGVFSNTFSYGGEKSFINVGTLEMKALGSISGRVQIYGQDTGQDLYVDLPMMNKTWDIGYGDFTLDHIPPGEHRLRFRERVHLEVSTYNIQVEENIDTTLDTVYLPTIAISSVQTDSVVEITLDINHMPNEWAGFNVYTGVESGVNALDSLKRINPEVITDTTFLVPLISVEGDRIYLGYQDLEENQYKFDWVHITN